MRRVAATCLLAVLLPGCAALSQLFRDPQDTVVLTLRPDPLYEELVPHYVELCAVSQYRPLDKPLGGIPGHAVMYLKGACRDETAGYPRLRPCVRNETDRSSFEHGAGVSVNKWFKNVNWVATPGKSLFYDGDLATYEALDEAHFDATGKRALEIGMFEGVQIHPVPEGEEGPQSIEAFVTDDSMGTDFALRFGRSVFCARVPMTEPMMKRTMDYLNALNDEYQVGQNYQWSGYSDNCVHTLHNAIAAAGIWKPKSVRAVKMRQMFNIAVPANTFVDLAFLTNEYPIEDFDKLYRDKLAWKNLVEEGWLPASPGNLVKTMSVHQENELYDSKFRMLVLEGWFKSGTTRRARELLTDGRFVQLDANLRYFMRRYEQILADRKDEDGDFEGTVRGSDYREARRLYYSNIEEQRNRLLRAQDRLEDLDRLRTELLEDAYQEWKKRVPKVDPASPPPPTSDSLGPGGA
jgi:hypothetical protein